MEDHPYFPFKNLYPPPAKSCNMNHELAGSMRPFSATNPDLLVKSAKASQSLLIDVQKVMNTLASSKPFANGLMNAAQSSEKNLVTEMIRKIGLKNQPDIMYNPDGIRFDFHPITGDDNCHIIISLKWRDI
ncbi:hypothetical protein [Peribacillus sp. SI8-4]|uniref:hypothetical protein n=1 Tax=Peribacillus sp. SI8-4 TaxID=3048009 RepID=UPI00255327C2|nr:hypothetical protein [Peribacillus sp. SI8-4]